MSLAPDASMRASRDHYHNARERAHVQSVIRDIELAHAGNLDEQARAQVRALRNALPSRDWHHEHTDGGISLGCSLSTCCRQVTMINAGDKSYHTHKRTKFGFSSRSNVKAFVLWFGAYGDTRLHVYSGSLDDALEECAAWLLEHAPGHLMQTDNETYQDLMADACKDAGLAWPVADGVTDMEPYWKAEESATADMTHTESGYLTSYEWGIALENPTTEDLYRYVRGL